jgi:UDP-N-acetylmuramoylalanine--D-glutamate ligase
MFSINKLKKKNFAVYGLGATGKSIISYFKKRGFSNYCTYDDYKKSNKKNIFIKYLKTADFIILSPGINIIKSKLKKNLLENKQKIISDLDLFYMTNSKIKTIVVTGTNGKSTTCKMLEHLLKKNKINSHLGGNIGTPILKLKSNKNTVIVIEASSYQLSYSKFVKPSCALILNISNDHLEWHGNMKNYVNSKFKIFLLQNRQNISILKQKKLIKIFKKKKFKSRLKIVSPLIYKNINEKINNDYLNLDNNLENMSFVYEVSKIFKINKKNFINSMTSFKGLPHRY